MLSTANVHPDAPLLTRRRFGLALGLGWAPRLLAAGPHPVLPRVELETQDGARLRLETWQDRLVIVNFWATWCAPCRREMTELQRFADRADESAAVVVGVAVDQSGWPAVMPFLRQHAIRFPVALGDRAILRAFGFTGPLPSLPQTLVFGVGGQLLLHARTALSAGDFEAIAGRIR